MSLISSSWSGDYVRVLRAVVSRLMGFDVDMICRILPPVDMRSMFEYMINPDLVVKKRLMLEDLKPLVDE